VECLIGQITKLLVHYGCKSGLGIELQVTMELLIMELGLSLQPLQESFATYGKLIVNTWIRSVWEKASKFNITIKIAPLPICPPREGDKWFMQVVRESGVTDPGEWAIINRFCCHQKIFFLLDVLDAGGKCVDKKYLDLQKYHKVWSTIIFPLEKPPRQNIALWQAVVYSLAPRGQVQKSVSRFSSQGHKVWEWRFHEESNCLLNLQGAVMDIYTPSEVPRYANRPNFWMRSRIGVACEEVGDVCSVKSVALAVYSILSVMTGPYSSKPPVNFWNVVEEWGKTWIWENLTGRGDATWLAAAIADNSLVAVTDGSYMREIYPHINLAAFVFECSKGRGRLWGSFVEHTPDAGSYRGELLGLMAIHLILRGVNVELPNLRGLVLILSDCLGALNKVRDLPPYRIPTQCSHSDILKNIMANCSKLTFTRHYSHVKAHQYDGRAYGNLP
jgi:hypothetical protein